MSPIRKNPKSSTSRLYNKKSSLSKPHHVVKQYNQTCVSDVCITIGTVTGTNQGTITINLENTIDISMLQMSFTNIIIEGVTLETLGNYLGSSSTDYSPNNGEYGVTINNFFGNTIPAGSSGELCTLEYIYEGSGNICFGSNPDYNLILGVGGSCSDEQYTDQITCEAAEEIWNFWTELDVDWGACYETGIPEIVYGCMDIAATNYDPDATVDDGSCEYEVGDTITNCNEVLKVCCTTPQSSEDYTCILANNCYQYGEGEVDNTNCETHLQNPWCDCGADNNWWNDQHNCIEMYGSDGTCDRGPWYTYNTGPMEELGTSYSSFRLNGPCVIQGVNQYALRGMCTNNPLYGTNVGYHLFSEWDCGLDVCPHIQTVTYDELPKPLKPRPGSKKPRRP